MESGVTLTPDAESRLPKAPAYVVCVAVAIFAATAGIFLRSMPVRKVSSMLAAPERFDRLRAPALRTTTVPQNSLRFISPPLTRYALYQKPCQMSDVPCQTSSPSDV